MQEESKRECKYCQNKRRCGEYCHNCYRLIINHGTVYPSHWEKECYKCKKKLFSKHVLKYCEKCLLEETRDRRVKWYRKRNGLDVNAPRMLAPKGNGHINNDGYRIIMKRNNEFVTRKNGVILEHIFVMSNYLGRPLRKGETVHHKNGIRDDNRIENLELWHKSQPAGQRVEDKIAWCKEFLMEYGYSVTPICAATGCTNFLTTGETNENME